MLFQDKIKYMDIVNATLRKNGTFECGTYEQLEYWSNNFDDFAVSILFIFSVSHTIGCELRRIMKSNKQSL